MCARDGQLESTMTKNEYNGHYNYETWCVSLWMDNEQSDQEYWAEQANEAYKQAEAEEHFTKEERAALNLADTLKERHEEAMPELKGVFADMLNASMSEVNWMEIAKNLIEAAKEEHEHTT